MNSNNVVEVDFRKPSEIIPKPIISDILDIDGFDVDEVIDTFMSALYSFMMVHGYKPDNTDILAKDSALVMESIKSLLLKSQNQVHPLQLFADKSFKIQEK